MAVRPMGVVLAAVAGTLGVAGVALTLTPAGDPAAGMKVFTDAGCGGCHTLAAARSVGTIGPNLDTLQPAPERVQTQVTRGGATMPAFSQSFSAQQIADVAEVVAQGSRGWRPPAAPAKPEPSTSPTAPRRVAVTLREWRVSTVRSVRAGAVVFEVRNAGTRPHQLVVLRTDRAARGLPVVDGRVREIGRVKGVAVPVGARRTLSVTLRAGSYVLISNRAGDVARGMAVRVRVTPAPASSPTPTPTPAPTPTPTPTPPVPTDGKELFRANCGGCHTLADAGTTGTAGPNLGQEDRSSSEIARQIRSGEADGSMPSFTGRLTDAQIEAIATYVVGARNR